MIFFLAGKKARKSNTTRVQRASTASPRLYDPTVASRRSAQARPIENRIGWAKQEQLALQHPPAGSPRGGRRCVGEFANQRISEWKPFFADRMCWQIFAQDGDHYSATVTSKSFSGKTRVEQHKMVYDAFNGKMGSDLHALKLKTVSE